MLLPVTVLIGCGGMSEQLPPADASSPDAPAQEAASGGGRELPTTWRGVTLESVRRLGAVADALQHHRLRPMARLVFQDGTGPDDYVAAVRRLHPDTYLMGEILDSSAVRGVTVRQYRARTRAFVERFGRKLDVYEIGNELNGEWLGRPKTIDAKVAAAYDVVEREHADLDLRSAITLNYWPSHDCYAQPWEATLPFARQLPARVRHGVDFVLLSFYETACSPRAHPSVRQFARTLNALKSLFPGAQVGLGEVGAQGRADGLPHDPTLAEKKRIAERYLGMHDALRARVGPRYVGGYFWWYYTQDAVPWDRPGSLWPTLERLFATMR